MSTSPISALWPSRASPPSVAGSNTARRAHLGESPSEAQRCARAAVPRGRRSALSLLAFGAGLGLGLVRWRERERDGVLVFGSGLGGLGLGGWGWGCDEGEGGGREGMGRGARL